MKMTYDLAQTDNVQASIPVKMDSKENICATCLIK